MIYEVWDFNSKSGCHSGWLAAYLRLPQCKLPSYARSYESHKNNITLVLQAKYHSQIGLRSPGFQYSYLVYISPFRHKTNSTRDSAVCNHRGQRCQITRGCSHAIPLGEDHGVPSDQVWTCSFTVSGPSGCKLVGGHYKVSHMPGASDVLLTNTNNDREGTVHQQGTKTFTQNLYSW